MKKRAPHPLHFRWLWEEGAVGPHSLCPPRSSGIPENSNDIISIKVTDFEEAHQWLCGRKNPVSIWCEVGRGWGSCVSPSYGELVRVPSLLSALVHTSPLVKAPSPHHSSPEKSSSPSSPALVSAGNLHVLLQPCLPGVVSWLPMDTYSHLNPSQRLTHLAQLINLWPKSGQLVNLIGIFQIMTRWKKCRYSCVCQTLVWASQWLVEKIALREWNSQEGKNRIVRVLGAAEQLVPYSLRVANIWESKTLNWGSRSLLWSSPFPLSYVELFLLLGTKSPT